MCASNNERYGLIVYKIIESCLFATVHISISVEWEFLFLEK